MTGFATGGVAAAQQQPATPQHAPATPPENAIAWTDSTCGALAPVVETLRNLPSVDLNDPAATRQAYLDRLGEAQQRAEQALQALETAGPPPVQGGEEVAQDVRDQVTELRDNLADARAGVEAADPGDVVAVGEAIAATGNMVDAAINIAQAIAAISGDPELRPAFEQAQSCEPLR